MKLLTCLQKGSYKQWKEWHQALNLLAIQMLEKEPFFIALLDLLGEDVFCQLLVVGPAKHPVQPHLGLTCEDKSIHVVCALKGDNIWMITAYYPAISQWLDDFKTRRR